METSVVGLLVQDYTASNAYSHPKHEKIEPKKTFILMQMLSG